MNSRSYLLPPEWETAVTGWLAWLRLGGMSPTSIGLRRSQVRAVARRSHTERPGDVTLDDLVRLCSERNWSREHRRATRTSLNSFFDWCVRNAVGLDNPAAKMPTVRPDKPRPRPATEDIWADLVATAAPRELLMIRLAGEAGLRARS